MANRVIFVLILILAGVYLYATEQLPSLEIGDPLGPKAFPRLLGFGLLLTAVVLFFEMLRERKSGPAKVPPKPGDELKTQSTSASYMVVGIVVVWTFLYFLVFEPLGYVIATTVYLLVLMSYFNRGKWMANGVTAVLFCLGSYFMFVKLLGVTLAPGLLPF